MLVVIGGGITAETTLTSTGMSCLCRPPAPLPLAQTAHITAHHPHLPRPPATPWTGRCNSARCLPHPLPTPFTQAARNTLDGEMQQQEGEIYEMAAKLLQVWGSVERCCADVWCG